MSWRVLLIGCPTHGLTGVAGDLARIRRMLTDGYGVPTAAIDERATARRADIVDGFARLVDVVRPHDRVFVYYSGHGCQVRRGDRVGQSLVPVDYDESTIGDFRGVLAEELGGWFTQLSEKTDNVTWVADCCHAAGASRGTGRIRAVARSASTPALFAHLDALDPGALAGLDRQVNPRLVRVCAAATEEYAYEAEGVGGYLTLALTRSLEALGHRPVVCSDLARRVDAVVHALSRDDATRQTTVFGGPVERWWLEPAGPRRVFATGVFGPTWLRGGRMLDQRPGDRYALLGDGDRTTAELVVERVTAHASRVTCEPPTRESLVEPGMTAVLRHAGVPRGEVALVDVGAHEAELERTLTATGYLRLAGAVVDPAVPRVASVELRDGQLSLRSAEDRVIGRWPIDGELHELAARAEELARQAALVALRADADAALTSPHCVVWESGAIVLTAPEDELLYMSAFSLSSRGEVRLLNRRQPDGEAATGTLRIVYDPADVDDEVGLVVAVVSDWRVDLRGWVTTTTPLTATEALRGGDGVRFQVHVLRRKDRV